MAELKKILEEGLMAHGRIEKMFDSGPSIDETNKKHFKIKTDLIESSDAEYDVHDCTITIKSDDDVDYLVTVRAVIVAMKSLREECGPCMQINDTVGIAAVIDNQPVFSEDKKQVDISFLVINNIERN